MSRKLIGWSRPTFALALLATLAVLALGGVQPARTDDTELLRFSTQNPYLMILLDTSRSMNLPISTDTPLPGQGDDPDSRIYASKEALFTVFRNVDDVNFGFMSFNQNRMRVRGKHYLYYVKGSLPAGYPDVGWPRESPNDPMFVADADGDGILEVERNPGFTDTGAANGSPSDLVTFGTAFKNGATVYTTACSAADPADCLDIVKACQNPLDLGRADERARVNAFAKNGTENLTTTIWVETAQGNKTYRLTLVRNAATSTLGQQNLPIKISADEVNNCNSIPAVVSAGQDFTFSNQAVLDDYLFVDNGPSGEGNGEDVTGHLWPWKDAVDGFTCPTSGPFTGYGFEGNYDSGKTPSQNSPPIVDPIFETSVTNDDRFCITPGDCIQIKPIKQTQYEQRGRPLDSGDFLPWDWLNSNKQEFLKRLAPNWNGSGTPDFGIAGYFDDFAADASGTRRLKDDGQVPLVAEGDTALARAMVDFRCWYMGTSDERGHTVGKCRSTPFGTDTAGWRNIACQSNGGDPNFGCRRPFLIIISDGDHDSNSCQEQAGVAAVSDMDQKSAVKTWYLQVGPTNRDACSGSGVGQPISNAGGGECVVIDNKQELLDTLERILGLIRESTRSFASAAVPTLQTSVNQSLYLSNFTPLRSSAIWDGHIQAFLKPLPTLNGKPRTDILCTSSVQSGCFLWDVSQVILDPSKGQYPGPTTCPTTLPLGPCPPPSATPTDWQAKNRRRVYYSMQGSSGQWPKNARLFQTTVKGTTPQAIERDLWTALGLAFDPAPAATNDTVRNAANATITRALTLKQAFVGTETTPRKFLLGDVFHSDPVVIGNPSDLRYFAKDIGHEDGTTCSANVVANPDRGYRCFFKRHQFRRKILLVGQNDGALHAYNAGIYDYSIDPPGFSNGTGNELFAYMPRKTMPAVNLTAQVRASTHRFSVDSPPVVTDAFIDPLHGGTDGAVDADDREWRTVAIGGLREGGTAYYAIDVTQPDKLTTDGTDIVAESAVTDTNWVPTCMNSTVPAGCGPIHYGAPLWEFNDNSSDQVPDGTAPTRIPMDEDGNGFADLGDTWSIPDVGRIRICTGSDCKTDVEDRYVTIFGGGLDPENKTDPNAGTFVYMVDIETGQVLYKRSLPGFAGRPAGAIPAAPAAVDLDGDGYLDRLYVVTTGGFVYRINLGADAGGNHPELLSEEVTTTAAPPNDRFKAFRIDATFWQPRLIFDASLDAATSTRVTRPIYYRPSVFFVAKLGLAGLAFGSGEREDLWTKDGRAGRFWVFVDDTDRIGASLPYDEGDLLSIDVASTVTQPTDLFVSRNRGEKGWFFQLGPNQRLITPGFSLFGVLFFSSYEPQTFVTTQENCDPLNPPAGGCQIAPAACSADGQDETGFCAKTGTSQLFVVNITNGNGLLPTGTAGVFNRSVSLAGQFVSQPFTEPGQNKNPTSTSGTQTADDMTANDIAVMNVIKSLYPSDCRFSNFRIDVKTVLSDTKVQRIAAVPQCIVQKNWKEF